MLKKFFHTLRYQIPQDHFEKERISDLVEYCKKYGFSDVTLFLNAEECNLGHITLDEAKPRVESMKRVACALRAVGITVSLNPWMEVGHLDRNKPLKGNQKNWTLMVDYEGRVSQSCVCMLDKNWREYFKTLYTYVVSELKPNIVWVEDDFRMHNHAPLKYGGCFCDMHMKLYNKRLGTNYSREEFAEKLVGECDDRTRKAWMEVSREVMNDFASFLGDVYRSCDKNVRVGLMSSKHTEHSLEYRDWMTVHKNLSADSVPINRLHLPCYEERASKDYYRDFFIYPFMLRSLLPENCIIYPEQENSAFNSFGKEPEFLQFQIEGALPLQIEGMTHDIFGFVGNGPKENEQYCRVVRDVTPYLEGVMPEIKYSELEGIIIPMDELSAYKRTNVKDFYDFYPDEHYFGGFLGTAGIPCKPSTKKEFFNRTVALSNGAINCFTNEEIVALFKNNRIILDGGAVLKLLDRGLGYLIKAKSATRCKCEFDPQSQEEVVDDVIIDGIKGYRASAYSRAGDYVKIEYASGKNESVANFDESFGLNLKTRVLDYAGNFFGCGIVFGEKFMIIPYYFEERIQYEQFNRLRLYFLREFLKKGNTPIVLSEHAGVYAYQYAHEDYKVLFLVNSTISSFESPLLSISGFALSKAFHCNKTNGKWESVDFSIENNSLRLNAPLKAVSTAAFILQTK